MRDTDKNANQPDAAARAAGGALADLYKALRTVSFYPNRHPLRTESLRVAHRGLTGAFDGGELTLVVTRAGFSAIEGGAVVDNNPLAQALARELFLRRTQRLTILADVSVEDLGILLEILTLDPQKFAASGALEGELVRKKVKTIWANEIDLSEIWAKRQAMEAGEEPGAPEEDELAGGYAETAPEETDVSIDDLISLMETERDETQYLDLARRAAAKAEERKAAGMFAPLLPAMEALARQGGDPERSTIQKQYALYTLEQFAGGAMTDFLLRKMEDPGTADTETLYRIVNRLGEKLVYPILHRLCIADSLFARKALATALIRIGPPALAPLTTMLGDERWYVVRNMVAIIGEIGSPESIAAMRAPLEHPDVRVRKEAIRTLVKIGGGEAERIMIALLDEKDVSVVRQAITSLGSMKSREAVQPLLDIVTCRDLLLSSLPQKKEAVQALGRIGDRRATPFLLDILESRRWLAWSKWEELKLVAVAALGQLGDETALPALKSRGKQQDDLGKACSEAVDALERLAGDL